MTTHAIAAAGIHDYGAAELKKFYQKFLRRGLELAVLAHIIVISTYLTVNYIEKLNKEKLIEQQKQQQRIITLTDLEPPPSATEEESPPPKLTEAVTTPTKDLTALTPEPVAREKAQEQTIKTQQQLEEIKTPVSSIGDTGKFVYSGPVKIEEKRVEEKVEKQDKGVQEKSTYMEYEVEKPPECVNLEQVKSMMVYPEVARQAGIEGRVSVKVLVGTDGSVQRVGSMTGPDVFADEVKSKAMNLQFTPGLQNGKPVRVWVTVPFNFRLKN
jgi:periplasmic protein TonB